MGVEEEPSGAVIARGYGHLWVKTWEGTMRGQRGQKRWHTPGQLLVLPVHLPPACPPHTHLYFMTPRQVLPHFFLLVSVTTVCALALPLFLP